MEQFLRVLVCVFYLAFLSCTSSGCGSKKGTPPPPPADAPFSVSDYVNWSASNPKPGQVAFSGDGKTIIVGAPRDNNSLGAAWIFTQTASGWQQQAKLVDENAVASLPDPCNGVPIPASTTPGTPQLGGAVALSYDGNTALIGASTDKMVGAAWIFKRTGNAWGKGQRLVPTVTQGVKVCVDTTANVSCSLLPNIKQPTYGSFGLSVALSSDGHTALVGAKGDTPFVTTTTTTTTKNGNTNCAFRGSVGAAWIFSDTSGSWVDVARLAPTDTTPQVDTFGYSVALSGDGNTALIGGPSANANGGAVWFYGLSKGQWSPSGSASASSMYSGYSRDAKKQAVKSPVTYAGTVVYNTGMIAPATPAAGSSNFLVTLPFCDSGQQGSNVALNYEGTVALVSMNKTFTSAPVIGSDIATLHSSCDFGAGAFVYNKQSSGSWTANSSFLATAKDSAIDGTVNGAKVQAFSFALSPDASLALIFKNSSESKTKSSNQLNIFSAPVSQSQAQALSTPANKSVVLSEFNNSAGNAAISPDGKSVLIGLQNGSNPSSGPFRLAKIVLMSDL